MHRANATVVIALGLLGGACATGGQRAALGWSLGGEAHVFIAGDRFASDYYHRLTGNNDLRDSLQHRPLIAIEPRARNADSATVLSANGAAPARLTLARFHAAAECGAAEAVTELVLAFPPGGGASHSAPPSHVNVVALLDGTPFASGAQPGRGRLTRGSMLALLNGVLHRAEPNAPLRPLALDADQAADAGEVVLVDSLYAVGFRARALGTGGDTLLVTAVAIADGALRHVHWVMKPRRTPLRGGMMQPDEPGVRYSLRGVVAAPGGGHLLLVDEIADVRASDSRALAVDAETHDVIATQPLALRCP